jgi:hypothetical protein
MSKKPNTIDGQFVPRTIEMLKSPAMRVLGLSARRALNRIEIELAAHGGKDNGKLPVTKANFVQHGIHHNAVPAALRELERLGFIQIIRGRGGNGIYRSPNMFRLTYRPTKAAPTNEWRAIVSIVAAEIAIRAARNPPRPQRNHRTRKTRIPDPENGSATGPGKRVNRAGITGPGKRVNYLEALHLGDCDESEGVRVPHVPTPPAAPFNRTKQKGGPNGKGQ